MGNKHPRYRPAMDNRTWGMIVQDVDAYYAVHKKHRRNEENRMQSISTPILNGIVNPLYSKIQGMQEADIEQLIKEIDTLTKTNCRWQSYEVGPAIKDFAKTILFHKKNKPNP